VEERYRGVTAGWVRHSASRKGVRHLALKSQKVRQRETSCIDEKEEDKGKDGE
jgi:hypothetical protein